MRSRTSIEDAALAVWLTRWLPASKLPELTTGPTTLTERVGWLALHLWNLPRP